MARAFILAFLGLGAALPAASQSFREFPLPSIGTAPSGIVAGPDGALWFTEILGNQIGRMTTAGLVTEYPVPTAASGPGGITLGPDGALWFTEYFAGKIGRITKAGVIAEYPTAPGSKPGYIVLGPDGALWFTESGTNQIGRVTTAGVFTHFQIPTASAHPTGITVGSDGNLWFPELSANQIGRITPAGAITEFPLPNPGSKPAVIAPGLDGNLWFTENLGNRIGRITTAGVITEFVIPTASSYPGGIAAGQDGNLWFVEALGNNVGRITTAGVITEFPIPSPASDPTEITEFDGALWFLENDADQVGRISVGDAWPVGLAVDSAASPGSLSFVNNVLEPGETVLVKPTWRNETLGVASFDGLASNPIGPPGGFYGMPDAVGQYPGVAAGASADCGGNCYLFSVSNPALRPVLHWDASFTEMLDATGADKVWTIHVGNTFSDVAISSPFYRFIETMAHRNVTAGCGGTSYCPTSSTTRQQMAVFALVSKGGVGYAPPACGTPMFADVPASSPFCKWIEELARRGVVAGCGGGNYCPAGNVTRQQMAVFALATLEGSGFTPPACGAPMFGDVPASSPFCKWIEELARRGVVSGCGGGNYCPTSPVTREQMSVFLTVTFGLTLYGP